MADAVIPRFRAESAAVPGTYDPKRRPGSSGQRYFSDIQYANPNMPQRIFDTEAEGYETQAVYDARFDRSMDAAIDKARATNTAQAQGLQALNLGNLARQERPAAQTLTDAEVIKTFTDIQNNPTYNTERKQIGQSVGAMNRYNVSPERASSLMDVPLSDVNEMMGPYYRAYGEAKPEGVNRLYDLLAQYIQGSQLQPYGTGEETQMMAQGGIASIAPQGQGYYLGGTTDGMADQIPATIDNRQPAALSDGEFVIPADVVSHLGNGNSNSGAEQLYGMMDKIRKARTGSTKQGRQIDANKFLA
jgi:hypothetical protein